MYSKYRGESLKVSISVYQTNDWNQFKYSTIVAFFFFEEY